MEDTLSTARIESLREQHSAYEGQLRELQLSPSATDHDIAVLKRKKLVIKDEIAALSR